MLPADLFLATGMSPSDHNFYWKQLVFSIVVTGVLVCVPQSSLDTPLPQWTQRLPLECFDWEECLPVQHSMLCPMEQLCVPMVGGAEEWGPLKGLDSHGGT